MFTFTAKHQSRVQSILVQKDMNTQEFLDALSFALNLPDGQIVGFKDITGKSHNNVSLWLLIGLIITPSHVCQFPEILRQEAHEVMLKLAAVNRS
jgi:hypothetical protein